MTPDPAESATAGSSPTDPGTRGWWTVAFIGVPIVAASVALVADRDERAMLAAVVIIGLIPVWFGYLALSARWRSADTALRFAVALLALIAISASPNTGAVQSLVYPLIWTMAPALRSAVVQNVVFGVAATGAFVVGMTTDIGSFGAAVAIGVSSLAFSLAFGTWITRIAEWGEERARVLAELTSAQADLATAHREDGERAERERISRELHDTLTQSLTGLVMLAQRARALADAPGPDQSAVSAQLAMIDEVARDALAEARSVVASSAALRVDGGLAVAMGALAERMSRETGMSIRTTVAADTTRELDVILLRCTQEALANVRKHARASLAVVRVDQDGPVLTLTVTDDGIGLDAAAIESAHGFGLAGMRDRLRLVGGDLRVEEADGGGTRLRVTVPTPAEGVSA
ncbi:MAG: sensor histidine kinase [Naasia sp.]